MSWNQPICERDWVKQNARYNEDDVLTEIRMPYRLTSEHTEIERCAWCGEPTIFGVYVRADPDTVPYPAT